MAAVQAVLGWLARKLWLLLAILLLVAALLVSGARLLVHRLDDVRPWLVEQANSRMGLHLAIGEAKGDWQGLGPSFTFNDLTLTDDSGDLNLKVKTLSVGLRFWASLFTMEPKLAFLNADGLNLKLKRWPKNDDASQSAINRHQLEALFLKQLTQASLTHSQLELPSRYGPRTVEISKVSWFGGRYRHQAVGYASIREYGEQQVRFILDLYGLESRLEDLDARLFVDAQDLHLDPWVNTFLGDYLTVQRGTVNSRLWLDFEKGRVVGGQMLLRDSSLRFDRHDIKVDSWVLTFNATQGGWQLDSRQADVSTDGKPWDLGPMQFRQQGHDHLLYARQLNLAPLTPLLNLWRGLPPPVTHWLAVARPNGNIRDLYLAANQDYVLSGDASVDLNWDAKDELPGVKDLKLKLSWAGDKGLARFNDSQVEIDPGPHFRAPFALSELKGDLWLLKGEGGWQLRTGALALGTEDLAVTARGKVDLGAEPGMALAAEVSKLTVAKVGDYLPLTAMPHQVADYLNGALKGGKAQGVVLWQGAFGHFPYGDNSGTFLAEARIHELDLLFDSHWPALHSPDITARFNDAAMNIYADKGQLLAVPVTNLSADIPNLGHQPLLGIHADTHTQGPDVAALMNASPLADSVGAALGKLEVSGALAGNLSLAIPLDDAEQVEAKGQVNFADNTVRVLDAFNLTGVKGQLSFDNDKIAATGLQAKLYEQPLSLTLKGGDDKLGYKVGLDLGGRFDTTKVAAPWWQLTGQSSWAGRLDLLIKANDFDLKINAKSDLKGIASPYPFPANKAADEAWPLTVNASGGDSGVVINLALGKRAIARSLFARGKVQNWELGVGYAPLPDPAPGQGRIGVGVSAIDQQDWMKVLTRIQGGEGEGLLPPLTQVQLNAQKVLSFGHTLNSVSALAKRQTDAWKLSINSKELDGSLWLPSRWGIDPLLINLDRVDLASLAPEAGQEQKVPSSLSPADIPPFKFHCTSCTIQGVKLGELTAEGRGQGDDLLLPVIKQQSAGGSISGSGTWLAKGNYTDLDLQLDVDDIGKYLDGMGMASSLRDAPAKGEVQMSWPGGPQDFELGNVDGKVSAKLGQGYVADVSDKGARLLTVFSFDSLRRKLALDFRDLFDKGLYFDNITASGELKKGVLRSNQIKMDGVVGDMNATGWTDLVNRNLAYDISFKPNVTGNLPVLAAFAVTPVTGVAVYALTKIFGPVIDVVTEIRFNLTGTIDNPHLEEVSRSKGSVPLPKPPDDGNNGEPEGGQPPAAGSAAAGSGEKPATLVNSNPNPPQEPHS